MSGRGIGIGFQVVERAGVHLAGLDAHDRRSIDGVQRFVESDRVDSTLVVSGDDRRRRAEPEEAKRTVDRDVPLRADDDLDRAARR